MTVLVAYASKHGATAGIADAIAEVLRAHGYEVELNAAAAVNAVEGYEAVVLGSGVYAGRWLPAARRLVARHEDALAGRPLWLFSSGPTGGGSPDDAKLRPRAVDALRVRSGARDHAVFGGRLEVAELGPVERLVVRLLRAPTGDYRDWERIRAWAEQVAVALAH